MYAKTVVYTQKLSFGHNSTTIHVNCHKFQYNFPIIFIFNMLTLFI